MAQSLDDTDFSVLVCAPDAQLRVRVLDSLRRQICPGIAITSHPELSESQVQEHHGSSVAVIFAYSAESSSSQNSEFSQIVSTLSAFSRSGSATRTILLLDGMLTLDQHCQLLAAGLHALIDLREPGAWEQWRCKMEEFFGQGTGESELELFLRDCPEPTDCGIVGIAQTLQRLLDQTRRAARISDVPVLIFGESGTGKQKIAEYLHRCDPQRRKHPFVSVNCAAITGSLAESELFGHRTGAFTGATGNREGYFRSAQNGTILLDEVSELDPQLQPKILRLLQESCVRPVGDDHEFPINVRVIAATNRDLTDMVEQGQFRLDLYQRLRVIQLNVPALRERPEDVPLLFDAFLSKYAGYYHAPLRGVDQRIYALITRLVGKGNVRELENLVRQMLVLKKGGDRIELTDLPQEALEAITTPTEETAVEVPEGLLQELVCGRRQLDQIVTDFEKEVLSRLLRQYDNRSELARSLGITRKTLYNKLQKYNLHPR